MVDFMHITMGDALQLPPPDSDRPNVGIFCTLDRKIWRELSNGPDVAIW